MLVDRARYPVIPFLEECFPVIRDEWRRVPVEDETVMYEPGCCVGFDPNIRHETENPGAGARDLFVLDVLATRTQEAF